MEKLRLWLLGGFRAEVGGEAVPDGAWQRSSSKALVKQLALQPGHRIHREALVDGLWPASDLHSGIARLNKATHFARRALGSECLRLQDNVLSLEGNPLWIDLDAFEQCVRKGETETALTMYTGELLPENRFEPWVEARRSHLRMAVTRLLLSQAADREARGDMGGAITSLERLVMIDPLHEEGHARLMRLNAGTGDRAAALRWYARLAEGLRGELGVDPNDELRRLQGDVAAGRIPLIDRPVADMEARSAALVYESGSHDPVLQEERKRVTVVMVNVVDSSSNRDSPDLEDIHGMALRTHARVRADLERHGGSVEGFVGDSVMAAFGAPLVHEDDAERAVRAALIIRDWIAEQPHLQARIAVNTGEALVSLRPHLVEGEAIVSGELVTTASRMQVDSPLNVVLVAEPTFRATRHAIRYREAPTIRLTQRAHPLRVWEAVESVSLLGMEPAEQAPAPFMGRDRELELLRSILARVRHGGTTQLVTIVGAAGIGKSRLVGEFFASVEQEPYPINWHRGRCLPYGDALQYWALGEIVKATVGVLETDRSDEVEAKLHRTVTQVVVDASEARWLTGELRVLMGLANQRSNATGDEDATAAWRRYLEAIGSLAPTVLVFEDLHWADEGLLDFIDGLVEYLRSVPIMVVGTARPELLDRRRAWGGGKSNTATISLQPLGKADTARLISALLEDGIEVVEDQHALIERAGGNPLFIEQYVRMLNEHSMVSVLPESVQDVIAARLDTLPRPEKEVLQEAAVHGKAFWMGGVGACLGIGVGELEGRLRALERKDFVLRQPQSIIGADAQYTFKHVLLRDVAYSQLPRRARAQKHRRAGEWMEGLGRPEDHAELLAYHYESALKLVRASGIQPDTRLTAQVRDSLLAAGMRAMGVSAFASAAEFFARALAYCADDDSTRPRLLLERARALLPLSGPGLGLLRDALPGLRAAGDIEGAAEAACLAARYSWFAGDRAGTDRYMAQALEVTADRPRSRARAATLTSQSGFDWLAGRFSASVRVGVEALPLVEALAMQSDLARLHCVIGAAHCCLGEIDGLREIESGISVAQAAGIPEMVVSGYRTLSAVFHLLGRIADARRAWEQTAELAERHGLSRMLRVVRAEAVAWALVDGRWNEAVGLADELIALADVGDRSYTDPIVLGRRAWIRLARGDTAGADQDSERAVELARPSDAQAQSAAFAIRAAVALTTGRSDEAGALASALAEIGPVIMPALASAFPTLMEVAWVFRDLSRESEFVAILEATPKQGPWEAAARAIIEGDLVRAADLIDRIGHGASGAYAHLRAAEWLAAQGRGAEAAVQRAQGDRFHRMAGAAPSVG